MKLKNFPIEYLEQFGDFGIAFLEYIFHKLDQLLNFAHTITLKNAELFMNVKFQAIARLIWSSGKLEKRIRYLAILIMSWVIFLLGGIFQGSIINPSDELSSQFLVSGSGSILLGEASAATYTADKTLSDKPTEHEVKEGETLVSIGKNYGISIESIKYANDLVSNDVKVGTKLVIPPVEGTLHTVKKGDTLDSIAKKYGVPSQTIVDFNYIDEPYILTEGEIVTIPDAKLPKTNYYASNNNYGTSAYGVIPYDPNAPKGSGQFQWPFSGIITQGFHQYHPAIDIAANTGDVVAADKGKVVRAGWWQGGYGNAVQIDHGNGYVTTYAHMSSIAVSNGQDIGKGQKIGVVGSTGHSTGPHVHFTIQFNGKYVNPLSLL